MHILRTAAAAAAAAISLTALAAASPARAATPAFAGTAADGAHVVSQTQVDSRTMDVTISSPAVKANTTVRLLLPPGWSASATRTWPVLYLLHGCCDTDQTWTQKTDVTQQTAGAEAIIAMSDGGPAGFYSNWWNFGLGGENWETYTATELPQILQSGFRASTVQAIGGVSTGGGAALFIAAHHPGSYVAVASYSGMDCVLLPQSITAVIATLIQAGIDVTPLLWGDPTLQKSIWQDHDPCSLTSSLRGTQLFLSVGSGVTGSGGQTSCPAAGGNILESVAASEVNTFAGDLTAQGIPFTSDFYSGGCHDWPSWSPAFDQSWPMLKAALGA